MSDWDSISFKFAPLEPLKSPLEGALTALELVEAVLEAVLDFVKVFLVDILNPIKSVIALLLAAIRAIINQIASSGFSVLLVYPDFNQPDFGAVINSVSGSYPRFESNVIGKFFDTSDFFRPQYPPGSAVAMIVMYIGASSPGDLMRQILALLSLIRHPEQFNLPAPVNVKVLPTSKSGSSITQFRQMFDSDLKKALSVEWRMPEGPSGSSAPGFGGHVTGFYNSFRFPSFIVERIGPFPGVDPTKSTPQGQPVFIKSESTTLGKNVDSLVERWKFPRVVTDVTVRERDGTVYKNFPKKFVVAADELSGFSGLVTGKYAFLDDDPSLEAGKTYYYRVRAFFGDPASYVDMDSPEAVLSKKGSILVRSGNSWTLDFSRKFVLGKSSTIVRGFVPRTVGVGAFDAYKDVYRAIIVGLLLNFDFPSALPTDSDVRRDQKTGWGSLGSVGGQIAAYKAALKTSEALVESRLFLTVARRLANTCLENLVRQPKFMQMLVDKWKAGAKGVVDSILDPDVSPSGKVKVVVGTANGSVWHLIGFSGGITPATEAKVEAYLAKEDSYKDGNPYDGPFPVRDMGSSPFASVQDRRDLADFLGMALSGLGTNRAHLAWYGVSLGDLFPPLLPFLYDFEQFMLSFLKAVESFLQAITDVIETILAKIRALEDLLRTISALIDLLTINVSLGILAHSSDNGSAEDLASALTQSKNKPESLGPSGLHSGLVMTFGGPGAGFVAAFKALGFILSFGNPGPAANQP